MHLAVRPARPSVSMPVVARPLIELPASAEMDVPVASSAIEWM
jgi:hypothetical protein